MTSASPSVEPKDVLAARELLRPVVRQTPLLESGALSALVGGPVYLKCENLQRGGSFKVRGAYVRIARLTAAERARGVVAASAGNHAQGVALAAGCARRPRHRRHAGRGPAAEGRRHQVLRRGCRPARRVGRGGAGTRARELAEQTGAIFIHPFDHADVIAGQGTVGLEIGEQCPQARTIVVPVGGGGLCSGVAVATSSVLPAARLIGVQAEAMAPVPASIAAGHPVSVAPSATMADGIAVAAPGVLTIELMSRWCSRVLTVTEENLSRGAAVVPGAVQAAGRAGRRGRRRGAA